MKITARPRLPKTRLKSKLDSRRYSLPPTHLLASGKQHVRLSCCGSMRSGREAVQLKPRSWTGCAAATCTDQDRRFSTVASRCIWSRPIDVRVDLHGRTSCERAHHCFRSCRDLTSPSAFATLRRASGLFHRLTRDRVYEGTRSAFTLLRTPWAALPIQEVGDRGLQTREA